MVLTKYTHNLTMFDVIIILESTDWLPYQIHGYIYVANDSNNNWFLSADACSSYSVPCACVDIHMWD